jgi:hypothetical protein
VRDVRRVFVMKKHRILEGSVLGRFGAGEGNDRAGDVADEKALDFGRVFGLAG